MNDIRLKKLADQLVNYSVSLKKGEHLLINCTPNEIPLVKELIESTYKVGGYPHVKMNEPQLSRKLISGMTEEQADVIATYERTRFDCMDAYISVATTANPMENAGISKDKMYLNARTNERYTKKMRKGNVKWCVCIYPTPLYANSAGMSLDDFEDYYFDVCCMDYDRFGREMGKLKCLLDDAARVRIVAKGTDLTFSVKGINKRVSAGDRNIPDGEVYTAPVRNSANGYISFNIPSIYNGKRFEDIYIKFEDGKAVEAHANFDEEFNAILDIDEGARYLGEFAFGLNPKLNVPLGLTLFDEKIHGSVHFAMGRALDVTDNGNRSSIHWDLVLLQTKDIGGGEVYIDDKLIRKDGEFVLPELEALNAKDFSGR